MYPNLHGVCQIFPFPSINPLSLSGENKPSSVGNSKKRAVIDLACNLLDSDSILPEHVTDWPGVNALTVCGQSIFEENSPAGGMCFILLSVYSTVVLARGHFLNFFTSAVDFGNVDA